MCMHCNSPYDVPKLKILHQSLWKTHLAFRDYSEQLYSSRLQKALLIHIFCLCCKYPKYSGKYTHYWLLLITVSSSIIFLSHKSILLLLSKIRKTNEHQGITKCLYDIMLKKVYAQFKLRRQCIYAMHKFLANAIQCLLGWKYWPTTDTKYWTKL